MNDESYLKSLGDPAAQRDLRVRKHQFKIENKTFFEEYSPANRYVDKKRMITRLLDDGVECVIAVRDLDFNFITSNLLSEKVTSEIRWKHEKRLDQYQRSPCKYGLCK